MSHLAKVQWAIKASRIGWYAARQAMLKHGASLHDVAWVLVSILMIQGA